MNADYNIFFSMELLHEYFMNQRAADLEIVPAEDCRPISKNLNLHFRTQENKLMALIKQNGENGPFMNNGANRFFRRYYEKTVLRFYVKVKDPVFFNYTNVELFGSTPKKKFYFSNLANNRRNGVNYLSHPIEEYVSGKSYLPGNLVKDPATGNIFEAIKKHSTKKKSPFTDASLWAPKGLLHLPRPVEDYTPGKTYLPGDLVVKASSDQVYEAISRHLAGNETELTDQKFWLERGNGDLSYPTSGDQLHFSNGSYLFQLSAPLSKAQISIKGYNFDGKKPAFDRVVREVETKTFDKATGSIPVDFSSLSAGRYEISINNEKRMVYYDPVINGGNILGVIEIFAHLPAENDFALLDEDEKLKSPRYVIHFANRRVLWKYIRKDGKAESITDTGDTGYAFNLSGNDFVSSFPIALSENVIKTLRLEFNTKDFRIFPLPNPQVKRLTRHNQLDYDYFCSEVYLNY